MAAVEGWPSSATARGQRTMARILAWQASMCALLGDLQTSRRLIRESLLLLDSPTLADEDTRLERAHIALELGYTRLYTDPGSASPKASNSTRRSVTTGAWPMPCLVWAVLPGIWVRSEKHEKP